MINSILFISDSQLQTIRFYFCFYEKKCVETHLDLAGGISPAFDVVVFRCSLMLIRRSWPIVPATEKNMHNVLNLMKHQQLQFIKTSNFSKFKHLNCQNNI